MSGKKYDVFISYRHSDGKDKAISLEANFERAGYRTFRDDNELRREAFDKGIEKAVLDAPVFVMVLTPDYFKRCNQEGDWVRREIDLAIENGKVIIPINYNGVLKGVPDYLDEEFRKKVGCHNFLALHTDTSFKATLKEIIDRDIKPNVSIVVNNNNRAKLSVKTDANCELIEDDEIIATLQEGTTKQIFVEKGEHEFIARSTEKPDIEQSIEKIIDDINSKYIIKIKLASKLHKKTKEWWEKNKSILLISFAAFFGIIIGLVFYNSSLERTETIAETYRGTIQNPPPIIPVDENVTSINNNEDSIRKAEEQKKEEERKLKEEQKKKKRDEEKKKRDEELFDEYVRKAEEFDIEYISNTDNKNLLDSVRYYYKLALEIKDNKDIRERLKGL
jgi:hypothetical protein